MNFSKHRIQTIRGLCACALRASYPSRIICIKYATAINIIQFSTFHNIIIWQCQAVDCEPIDVNNILFGRCLHMRLPGVEWIKGRQSTEERVAEWTGMGWSLSHTLSWYLHRLANFAMCEGNTMGIEHTGNFKSTSLLLIKVYIYLQYATKSVRAWNNEAATLFESIITIHCDRVGPLLMQTTPKSTVYRHKSPNACDDLLAYWDI